MIIAGTIVNAVTCIAEDSSWSKMTPGPGQRWREDKGMVFKRRGVKVQLIKLLADTD